MNQFMNLLDIYRILPIIILPIVIFVKSRLLSMYSSVVRINPLAANVLHVRHLPEPACRRRSAFTGKIMKKNPRTFRKRIKFATKWYTKLCK